MPPPRLTLLAFFAVLLASCGTLPSTFERSSDSTLVFTPSQWRFPVSIAGFKRAEVVRYDQAGFDCSVAYNHPSSITATVYTYPAGGRSLDTEVRSVSGEIERQHRSGPPKIRTVASFGSHNGIRIGHSYAGVFAMLPQELRSQTLVFRIGASFLKFRITYPEANAERAEVAINSFLAQYQWPK